MSFLKFCPLYPGSVSGSLTVPLLLLLFILPFLFDRSGVTSGDGIFGNAGGGGNGGFTVITEPPSGRR